jgi:Peptidase family C25/Secretion system C-terminal sorting domain
MKNQFFLLFVSLLYFTPLNAQVNLRDTTNQYDYIIITAPEFVNACQDFKTHKETVRRFQTLIVDTTQIYAEFDSAATKEDNIRNFISYAGTFWSNPKPKFFLIIGNVDAVPNFSIILHLSNKDLIFHSDYYYKCSIYKTDPAIMDFYVGRIPAINSIEVGNYLSKVIEYESNPDIDGWMNNNLFICQNDSGLLYNFLNEAIIIADSILPSYTKPSFITNDSSSVYYGNKDSIYNKTNSPGCSVLWFEGSHSDSVFISSDYFNLTDIQEFNNPSKYFLTVFRFIQTSIIDSNTNLAKELMVMPKAGSIGGSVFTGTTYWAMSKAYRSILAKRLFNPNYHNLGEIYDINLAVYGTNGFYTQRLANLWADPSLQLKYDIALGVDEPNPATINEFSLKQNFPNPFNPTTIIKYQVPVAGNVSIKIYNILGREMAELLNENKNPGSYEVVFDAAKFPSGVYFYRIQAGSFVQTKKMVLLR